MTSKSIKALEELVSIYNGIQYGIQYDIEDIIELFNTIKQDLERLEVLELSNKTLDQICETQHERLEVLEKENKELWENIEKYNHKFAEVERKKADLTQENEKLKKAIEILKEHIHICRNSCFYKVVLNGETELPLLDYELLKGVLGDE